MTYSAIRYDNLNAYRDAHRVMFLIPSWGPLTEEQFYLAHKTAMKAIADQAQQQDIDWSNCYALSRTGDSSMVATILTAVLNVLFPASAPFDALIEPAIEMIISLLLGSLTASLKNVADSRGQLQQLAAEAEAA